MFSFRKKEPPIYQSDLFSLKCLFVEKLQISLLLTWRFLIQRVPVQTTAPITQCYGDNSIQRGGEENKVQKEKEMKKRKKSKPNTRTPNNISAVFQKYLQKTKNIPTSNQIALVQHPYKHPHAD